MIGTARNMCANLEKMMIWVMANYQHGPVRSPGPMCFLPMRLTIGYLDTCAFGLVTDSEEYRFAYLDEKRKIFVSETYLWVTKKAKIIQWMDKTLRDSIETSPHTTPVKTANTTIHAYWTHLNREYQFGVIDESRVG
ncbi:hypothetical protein V1517DRAFT_194951 [Lipomyces orientalis]|uniref:Uncharacterized protein n=1 Tax=Lipomyces orientalis TaxID=1233043 RepID=A0ACC3TIB2_9ASCO